MHAEAVRKLLPLNMGSADRSLRFIIAPIILLLGLRKGGVWATLGGMLAAAMLFSGTTGHCPLLPPLRLQHLPSQAEGDGRLSTLNMRR